MANYTVSTSKHASLAAATADLVTLTGSVNEVTVFAHTTGTPGPIYFTVGDNPATAVSAADNTFVVYPGFNVTVKFDGTGGKVSLISAAITAYSVVAS
jgi:hypothetical protein